MLNRIKESAEKVFKAGGLLIAEPFRQDESVMTERTKLKVANILLDVAELVVLYLLFTATGLAGLIWAIAVVAVIVPIINRKIKRSVDEHSKDTEGSDYSE